MNNILVTGSNGQLGSELRELMEGRDDVFFTDVEELNICDIDAVDQYISNHNINLIINCAAYTNVDKAEEEEEQKRCFDINSKGAETLARVAKRNDLTLIHISTDYVFNGRKRSPYCEWDKCDPQNTYGKCKRAGELAIKKLGCKGIIIRTAWLYSTYGNNFVKTMIRLGGEKGTVSVIDDQYGTPTYARDLAKAIIHIAPQILQTPRWGEIFHFTDEGSCTWYQFAEKIMSMSGTDCEVLPITTEEYPTAAVRPAYSILDKSLIKKAFDVEVPNWEKSLREMLKKLKKDI